MELAVPHDKAGVIARLHEVGQVIERVTTADRAVQGPHPAAFSRRIHTVRRADLQAV